MMYKKTVKQPVSEQPKYHPKKKKNRTSIQVQDQSDQAQDIKKRLIEEKIRSAASRREKKVMFQYYIPLEI